MVKPQHKREIDKFIEEIEKAKTKDELENILKRLETFTKIYPYEENLIILAYLYGLLKSYDKALNILKPLKSYKAKYLEAEILQIIKKYKDAYRLFIKLVLSYVKKISIRLILNKIRVRYSKLCKKWLRYYKNINDELNDFYFFWIRYKWVML